MGGDHEVDEEQPVGTPVTDGAGEILRHEHRGECTQREHQRRHQKRVAAGVNVAVASEAFVEALASRNGVENPCQRSEADGDVGSCDGKGDE